MKNKLLFTTFLALIIGVSAHAQTDTTVRMFQSGMGIYAEFGLLPNNQTMREQLDRLQIKPFTSFMGSIVLAKRTESQRWFSEGRLIIMNSTNYTTDKDVRKAYLGGFGIGTDGGPKLVNNKRWNVLLPIGFDLMLYRLKIKGNQTATIGQVLQNPSSFEPVKLTTGNINLHAGIGADYKINFLPKWHDQVYISGKATYHLPILGRRKWKTEDVTISDLSSLKLNQVYLQIGLVFFPKNNGKMWGPMGMHKKG
ncbi:hypothetical protein [Dyadobacter sp. CY326]|uniref:hypothetical protein n=1 Tax=Dyadobacter sp. CY326 TaxID=2907300 RepID=UPI001F1EDCB7|nr:hypothetical protein [Dyadobacter sp. CY326]MCE7063722.1 hypothetical protein [Dyadobacter sp. CY326]